MSNKVDKQNNQNENEAQNSNIEKEVENLNNSKEIEKEYLEGEEHKDFNGEEEGQAESNLIEANDNNIKEDNSHTPSNFLMDKMNQMKVNRNIISGINRSMDKQMKNIEKDLIENKILMTEIPKNLNKLSHSLQKFPNISNFEQKSKLKTIKDLQDEKENLSNKLQKLIVNEKFLENEGFMQKEGIPSKNFSPVDQRIYESKKKSLQNKKEDLINKIDQIEEQIKQIVLSSVESSRKERIKNYIDNFERDKEIIETRAKKYFQETKERNQRIQNDLNKKIEKYQKEMDDKLKKEEQKKEEILKKFKEQEKAVVLKRTKKNDEKANMFKPFLKKNPKENIREYLFVKKYQEFKKEEQNLIEKENLRRKEKMKMDFNEINEFEKNVINNRGKFENEYAERKKKLLLEWKERKGTLPTYVGPMQELCQEELKKEIESEDIKKEKFLALKEKKMSFAYNIKNNKQPEINEKLKKQRTDLIRSLENPKLAVKEKVLSQRQKKAEEQLEKKKQENNLDNSINKKKIKIKIKKSETNQKLNNSSSMNTNFNDNKKLLSPSLKIVYPVHPKPDKKIDYLSELRNEKEKRNALSREKSENEELKAIKWEKALNSNKGNIIENINIVKEKAKVLDDNIKNKEKVLKLNGGVKNHPEIGEKISNLIIDSIEAKLSILNKFNDDN